MMHSFLSQRRQLVQLESARSEILLTGPYSVIQGSTLSCILYLTYILDMPQLFHTKLHTPQEQEDCSATDLKTFVDDAFLVATKQPNQTFTEVVTENMRHIEDYMVSNHLAINTEKTQVMLFTKDLEAKKNFKLQIKGKSITHQRYAKVLGNTLADDLSWNHHVTTLVIPALTNRVRTIKLVSKYLTPKYKAIYANSTFRSQLMFGMESWGGALKTNLKKIQTLQDRASKWALPTKLHYKNPRQRLKQLNWYPIDQEIKYITHCQTFKIINWKTPQHLAQVMPLNTQGLRLTQQRKLSTKPKWLGKNLLTRTSFRSRCYFYNTLPSEVTTNTDLKKFKKSLKSHMNKLW